MRVGGDPGGEEGGHVYSRECCVGELSDKHHRLRLSGTFTDYSKHRMRGEVRMLNWHSNNFGPQYYYHCAGGSRLKASC